WLGRIPRLRGGALPLLILLVAGMPAASAIDWNRAHSRPTTMELAAAWLVEHAPRGAQVVVEDSVLQLPPQLVLVHSRNLVARTIDEYRESGAAYLVASSYQSDRYSADPARHQDQIAAYHALMATTVPVATFTP